ncbi:hypothetical protein Cpir12675_004403 [Ceratocystis pirilliformis]|uniref:Uncharacterized protein n=1 Tax=Ceratocystis pirilliformis TaxID=259994 RepID=A0ABR3YXZ6_9PEZI
MTDWMGSIDDSVLLSKLSIPGTRHSTTDNDALDSMQTQNVVHGVCKTGYYVADVVATIYNFLSEHSRETVILRIKKGSTLDSLEEFTTLIHRYLRPDAPIDYNPASHVHYKGLAVRGKMLVLQDFESQPPGLYGLPWNSPLDSSEHLPPLRYTLVNRIKPSATESHIVSLSKRILNELHVAETFNGGNSKPDKYYTGTSIDAKINNWLGASLSKAKKNDHSEYLVEGEIADVGILAMDHPGKNLVEQIVKLNNVYRGSPSA